MIHFINDPPSTTETLISMKNAIDYDPSLFKFPFNIVINVRCDILFHEKIKNKNDGDTYGRAKTTKLKETSLNICTTN